MSYNKVSSCIKVYRIQNEEEFYVSYLAFCYKSRVFL